MSDASELIDGREALVRNKLGDLEAKGDITLSAKVVNRLDETIDVVAGKKIIDKKGEKTPSFDKANPEETDRVLRKTGVANDGVQREVYQRTFPVKAVVSGFDGVTHQLTGKRTESVVVKTVLAPGATSVMPKAVIDETTYQENGKEFAQTQITAVSGKSDMHVSASIKSGGINNEVLINMTGSTQSPYPIFVPEQATVTTRKSGRGVIQESPPELYDKSAIIKEGKTVNGKTAAATLDPLSSEMVKLIVAAAPAQSGYKAKPGDKPLGIPLEGFPKPAGGGVVSDSGRIPS